MYELMDTLFSFFGLDAVEFVTVADFIPWAVKVALSALFVWFVFQMIRSFVAMICRGRI